MAGIRCKEELRGEGRKARRRMAEKRGQKEYH
jgi:hypothetical protein